MYMPIEYNEYWYSINAHQVISASIGLHVRAQIMHVYTNTFCS